MTYRRLKLTQEHLSLLRHINLVWDDARFCVSQNGERPYSGPSPHWVVQAVHKILTGNEREERDISPGTRDRYLQLHQETLPAMQIVLMTGQFKPGNYEMQDHTWVEVNDSGKPAEKGDECRGYCHVCKDVTTKLKAVCTRCGFDPNAPRAPTARDGSGAACFYPSEPPPPDNA